MMTICLLFDDHEQTSELLGGHHIVNHSQHWMQQENGCSIAPSIALGLKEFCKCYVSANST
jgi:hypothetical protein